MVQPILGFKFENVKNLAFFFLWFFQDNIQISIDIKIHLNLILIVKTEELKWKKNCIVNTNFIYFFFITLYN